jgi:hypothetical protein
VDVNLWDIAGLIPHYKAALTGYEPMVKLLLKYSAESNVKDKGDWTVLMHAKVYCFTHQFLIPRLEELSLQRLTQVLLICHTPSDPFFSRLAQAIRLIYESTPSATELDDPARKLLSQYVALDYTTLPKESLHQLISEAGEFMIDVSQKLAQRIAANSGTTKSLKEHIDELKVRISVAEKDIQEWDSWNRRIRGNYRRGRGLWQPKSYHWNGLSIQTNR